MKLTKVKIENEGTILVADNCITDITSFLDPQKEFLLIKKTVNGWIYLCLFDKLGGEKYHWRNGSRHNSVYSANITFQECKKILNL
ncbi:MAG: hypothetical protein WC523_02780 [Patescibacteria group bacterium]